MPENQEVITSEIKCTHVTEVSVGQLKFTVEPRLCYDV